MPTYQYRCPHCNHEFEEYQSIVDPPVDKCPSCAGKPERLISGGAGFLFKGSGFYTTDYRSEGYKKAASQEKSDGQASEAKTGDSKKPDSTGKSSSAKPEG